MIYRADHNKNFTCLSGDTIRDYDLSSEALGLLVRLLNMPDDWKFTLEGISHTFNISKKTLIRLVKELKEKGYIEIGHEKGESGRFVSSTWNIYEVHHTSQNGTAENRTAVDGTAEYRTAENGTAETGNNILNIDKPNIDKPNIENTKYPHGEFSNVLLTDFEFKKLGDRLGETTRDGLIEELSCYLANKRKKYLSHYSVILTWARRREQEKPRPKSQPISDNPFTVLRREEGYE